MKKTEKINREGLRKLITKLLKESWSSDYFDNNSEVEREDEFLKSFKYFVDTYINGNFGQLKEMLNNIREEGQLKDLRVYIDGLQSEYTTKIKNWIIDNI